MSTTCEFRSVAEHEVDVEQIRIGRTRNDEIAGVREKGVRVVVVEGRSARAALDDNDAYTFLAHAGDLVVTGPTNTNLLDVYLVLRD